MFIEKIYPPEAIGIIGGGQLGKMIALSAKKIGYKVVVLDPNENAPAVQIADEIILGDFDDEIALIKLAQKTKVITYEFEHINTELLLKLENDNYKIYPSAATLKKIQNKRIQKNFFKNKGIAIPLFYEIESIDDLKTALKSFNKKGVVKACTGGYDGKGTVLIKNIDEINLEKIYQSCKSQEIILEELVNFKKEVSIIVAKNANEIEFYPVVENIHRDGILLKTMAPADIKVETELEIIKISQKIIEELDDCGVFCIEFFIDTADNVLVNEIAPRPHNSGHYSFEGCVCSQFEQIVRIMTGMPLGSSALRQFCVMHNILGTKDVSGEYIVDNIEKIFDIEDCHFHLYGKKEVDFLKKIGHITALDKNIKKAEEKALLAMSYLKIKAR